MRKILLVLFSSAATVLFVFTNGFTELNGEISSGASTCIWMFFGIPIAGLLIIPCLQSMEEEYWQRQL